jgi:hypothetical protein
LNDLSGHLVGRCGAARGRRRSARGRRPAGAALPLGGDEFALLLRVADEGDLANRALGLIAAIRGLRLPSLRERGLSISVGGVFCADPGGWSSGTARATWRCTRRRAAVATAGAWRSETPSNSATRFARGPRVPSGWPRHRPFGVASNTRPPRDA